MTKETQTPIDLPAQGKSAEKPALTRKGAIDMIKEDFVAIKGLDERKMVVLARLLRLVVRDAGGSNMEMLDQIQKLLSGNLDPKKLEIIGQLLNSVAAGKDRPIDDNGANLIGESVSAVFESGDKTLVRAMSEMVASVRRVVAEVKSGVVAGKKVGK